MGIGQVGRASGAGRRRDQRFARMFEQPASMIHALACRLMDRLMDRLM